MRLDCKDRYEWTLLWRDSQKDESGRFYGHSFYRDSITGKVSIKDMSGPTPDQTDDGVLWLDTSRPMVFWIEDGKMRASLPVMGRYYGSVSPEKSYCIMLWPDAIKAAKEFGYRVTLGEGVQAYAAAVFEVVNLFIKNGGNR